MNLDNLTHTSGEWLRGSGPESDIVISSRIRLARNLAAFPFTSRASAHQKADMEVLLRERIAKLDAAAPLSYISVAGRSPLDRQFLVERQLISREIAAAEGPRGVAFDERETVSLMINEEDQLRLQVMRSGLSLDEAWQDIDKVDDLPYFDLSAAAKAPLVEPGTGVLAFSNQFQIATMDEPMSVQRGVIAAYSKLSARKDGSWPTAGRRRAISLSCASSTRSPCSPTSAPASGDGSNGGC